MAKNIYKDTLQLAVIRNCRAIYVFVALFAGVIIASDAWSLITNDIVLQRWTLIVSVLVLNTIIWFLARMKNDSQFYFQALAYVHILLMILFTGLLVYSQRGVASRSVILFAVPIIMSATLLSRAAIFATATLSVAAYGLAVIRYFFINYGEAYKAELYTELAFTVGLFYIFASLVWIVVRQKR
jgi:hypothetical protein